MILDHYLDLNDLEKQITDGLISRQFHPTLPLAILNYTHEAKDKLHDNYTARRCRGLIYDVNTREVLARPMQAFFNLNDMRYAETQLANLPTNCPIEITEKVDGSLGVIYQYKDEPLAVATRGSFVSEQAIWATEYLRRYPKFYKPPYLTPLVEIIYPSNRIVVDYRGAEKLVLIAMIWIETGVELTYPELWSVASINNMRPPLEIVAAYPQKQIVQCADENIKNQEGYVAKFTDFPGQPPFRVKIKFSDYRLAHKAMYGMHDRDVWEVLSQGGHLDPQDYLFCPQEFRDWLDKVVEQFTMDFMEITNNARLLVEKAKSHKEWTRSDVAAFFTKKVFCHLCGWKYPSSILFSMYDGKDWQKILWKYLRPERASGYKPIFHEEV
jgi:RNA ligase